MNLKDMEMELELKAVRREVDKLKEQNDKYKKIILENGLSDEIDGETIVSIEEKICMDGIRHLADLFKNGSYDRNDVQNFDILHKNLRTIQGHTGSSKKRKKPDIKEALKIVEGFDK